MLTRIHQIEITNRCNLACVYCPYPTMKREKQDMEWKDFERSMQWVEHFVDGGNQVELAFTGIGEALLHPMFVKMIEHVRNVYQGFVHFSTNGILFDEDIAKFCRNYGVGVFVSMHRPEVAVPAKNLAERYGVLVGTNHSFVDSAIDWAGQVNWHLSAPRAECKYQSDGWGVILSNGDVTSCCMDSEGISKLGHIDDELGTIKMEPKALCRQCHLEVA